MDEIYERILEVRKKGEEAVLVTVVEKEGSTPAPPGTKMLVQADGTTLGTVGGGALERLAFTKALELLEQQNSALVRYTLWGEDQVGEGEATGMICGGRVALFFEYLGYAARAYLFGAGHVGQAVARYLRGLRWFVTVIDERQGFAANVSGVNRAITANYASALTDESLPAGGFYVIATPSHDSDYLVLKRILLSTWHPRYVGLVASRRKAAEFRERLAADLGKDLDLSLLYAPVGLDLGGRSPDEVALSIVAEMQALRYGKTGHKHMRLLPEG